MVDLAAATYCSDATIQKWTCPSCTSHPGVAATTFGNHTVGSRGFVAAVKGADGAAPMIVAAFGGTDPTSILNFVTDLSILEEPSPHPGCDTCEVHTGFYEAWLSVQDQVLSAVAQLQHTMDSSAQVAVTGHSMGGALAVHCALALRERGTHASLRTFGAPRVGNAAFARYSSATITTSAMWRVTHHRDPVPHLPPVAFGYAHAPHEVFYPDTTMGRYVVCDDDDGTEDAQCSARYGNVALDVMFLRDHLLYVGVDFTMNWLRCKLAEGEAEETVVAAAAAQAFAGQGGAVGLIWEDRFRGTAATVERTRMTWWDAAAAVAARV
eukprot:TRINITY_DN8069_c0_g1_i1.p1 TRINITY_DN8069_c0_g1~~TRINITY_DN8069_c0_g1_i1.p1  ORF type:complete len:351 (-),score=70.95 TRINITY_DN8069_c0_g1_i1:748-1719(-)